MKKAKLHKHVFLLSFFLTVAVFGMGLLLSYGLDFLRVEAVLNTMSSQELGTEAYILQRDFAEFFEADVCLMMHDQLYEQVAVNV